MGQSISNEKPSTPLTKTELIEQLQGLAHVEIDATYAFETAISKITDEDLADAMEAFRDDHVAHVLEISNLIFGYGGKAPKPVRDWKGFLLEGAMHLRSSLGREGTLKALRLVEILTLRFYEDILNQDVPNELRATITRLHERNERHLKSIESLILQLTSSETPRSPAESNQPTATSPYSPPAEAKPETSL